MARRSFVGRIGRALRNLVAPSPRQPPPPPPSREEPPKRGPGRDEYRDVWRSERAQNVPRANYQTHLRTFHGLVDPIEDDPGERLQLWESYVKHMVKDEGPFRRNSSSNMFWRDTGIDPLDFNWRMWRAAMGYEGNRRSRTP